MQQVKKDPLSFGGFVAVPSNPVYHLFNEKKPRTYKPKKSFAISFRNFFNGLSHRKKVAVRKETKALSSDWIVTEG